MSRDFLQKKLGEVEIHNYLPHYDQTQECKAYAVRPCGENFASLAASPSVMLILGFWESDALDDDEMRDEPFSCAI